MNKKKINDDQKNTHVKNMTFEQAVSELEQLLLKMEKGLLTLDESLRAYHEGVLLITHCQKELDRVEQEFSELNKSIDQMHDE